MASNTSLQVTGIDFDTIRANLVTFLRARTDFADYNFSDSAIGTLVDLLAYNTYYSAFYTNMGVNESFLDSAQLYENVVSRAKALGYIPISAKGATANVLVTFTTAVANATFRSLTINKHTKFTTTVNGVSYTFVTPKSYTVTANSTNGFRTYVNLTEGEPLTHNYVFSTSNTAFILPNANTDTRSVSVSITSSGNTQTYSEASDLNNSNSSSQSFFIEPDKNKLYKISFGDNVISKRPDYNSTVAVTYRVCNGERSNGANNFTADSTVAGQTSFTLRAIERATGGAPIESIESVRFNAPRLYETQNRAVTADDYKRLVLRDHNDIGAVNAWGGEDNDPPIYGTVYIAVKPKVGTTISSSRKTALKLALRQYNVQSINVELADATYLYIIPQIEVRYDSSATTLTASELAAAVAAKVISYESTNLGTFEGKFRLSKLLRTLDDVDSSITGTRAVIDIRKRFTPSIISRNDYTIKFNQELQKIGTVTDSENDVSGSYTGYGFVYSDSFTKNGYTVYIDDNGFGTARVYYRQNLHRVYIDLTAGTIDYDTGTLSLTNFLPNALDGDLQITARPESPNVDPVRNQILLIAGSTVSVIDDITGLAVAMVDDISTLGRTAGVTSAITGITTTTF